MADTMITNAPTIQDVQGQLERTSNVDERPDEQQPPAEGSVNLAPESPDTYEMPTLTDANAEAQFRQGAFDAGLSQPEVTILFEEMPKEEMTEESCEAGLREWAGSPMAIKDRLATIDEAFGHLMTDELEALLDEPDSNGRRLGNSVTLIKLLYNSAQRKLGRYSR